ncbi:MAG: hypothetical protein WB762_07335 [Candidatus Sulfotelmatobacter sp.]
MNRKLAQTIALATFALAFVLGAMWQAQARAEKDPYPSMASPEQYMMERQAEIALAQSAAPPSISGDAEVLVLGQRGYETEVKGKNGFVCMVLRSWTAGIDDPDFWNPKIRSAICFNPPAARSYLPITVRKTELVLAGRSKTRMIESVKAAFDKRELLMPESGAMCYMMSRHSYLSDRDGHWRPHLMFFVPQTDAVTWGADLPGSPILAAVDTLDRLTVFLIPVGKWSDGTDAPTAEH